MRTLTLLSAFTFLCLFANLQSQSIFQGELREADGEPIMFGNVALYNSSNSTLVKVESTDVDGKFKISNIDPGHYFFKATYIGFEHFIQSGIELKQDTTIDLGLITLSPQYLEEVTVVGKRSMVVVKPDRTIFNVEGTINNVGGDAISLLRKAPGVTVDNNDNISVLGIPEVILYVDGRRVPLSGEDLSNYLKNITSDQIDKIEIITSPSAKYEAEGNAGIINIRLKKDTNLGANGTLNGSFTQGNLSRYNLNTSGNYRNKKFNLYGKLGYFFNNNFHNINFDNYQNGLFLDEIDNKHTYGNVSSYSIGGDFFLHQKHTIGLLYSGTYVDGGEDKFNRIAISSQQHINEVDSVLVANTKTLKTNKQTIFNLNYQYAPKAGESINIDFNYGSYRNDVSRFQPNVYYNDTEDVLLSQSISRFLIPNDIMIYTTNFDYEKKVHKGLLNMGAKYGRVETNNTFKVFDVISGVSLIDESRSNLFDYIESVYAGYINYAHPLGENLSIHAGLRLEQTHSKGKLTAFSVNLEEPPTELRYLSSFPSAGIAWTPSENHGFSLSYGRRINRPDYNVLNPFKNQSSEISIETGNPFLVPEIINRAEVSYTLAHKYNFKFAYGRTNDKITRLIGSYELDPRANYVSWDNLSKQTIYSFNASVPFSVKGVWDVYFNLNASHISNQADYGEEAAIDIQVFAYTFYQQSIFWLPKDIKAEISGYYTGPGIWGAVFRSDPRWGIDLGLQREFFDHKLKVRLSFNNIFNNVAWEGVSIFDGLESYGNGRRDNRFVSLGLKYNLGNQNLKSRKRKTGIENESKRVKN